MLLTLLLLGSTACAALRDDGEPDTSARDESARWPTLGLRAGAAILTGVDSEVRLDSETLGRGTGIDLEDDFSLEDETTIVRADAFWRIDEGRRHRLELSWFDIRRNGTRVIDRDIQFGDRVFPVNAEVRSFLNTEVVKFNYRYNLFVGEDWEAGLSLGAHVIGFDVGLSQGNLALEESFGVTAPMPVLGAHAEWLPFERIRTLISGEALYIRAEDIGGVFDTNDLEGLLVDARVGIEWEPVDHFGVGVGYNYFLLDAEYGEQALALSAKYDYSGLLVYGTLGF